MCDILHVNKFIKYLYILSSFQGRVCHSNRSEMTANMSPSGKREGYINKPDYFMGIALLAAKRSKDPKCQVGACIVNQSNVIVGVGYNGTPNGCDDDEFPWDREEKHLYVCHAEMNAILNKNSADVKNCTIYASLFPCNECAKMIIQSGITEVVFLSDIKAHKPEYKASKKMLKDARVKYRQLIPQKNEINIILLLQGAVKKLGLVKTSVALFFVMYLMYVGLKP